LGTNPRSGLKLPRFDLLASDRFTLVKVHSQHVSYLAQTQRRGPVMLFLLTLSTSRDR